MSPSRRDDGAALPSGGTASIRGAALIAVAVLVGVVLLGKGFDSGLLPSTSDTPSEQAANGNDGNGGGDGTTTTSTTAVVHTPAEVRVLVLNGSGLSGVAGTASQSLAAAGYVTLDPDNATATPTTVVYFVPGFDADAAAAATVLGIPATAVQPLPTPPPVNPADANVIVVLGADSPIRA